jgi:hypothetical protein
LIDGLIDHIELVPLCEQTARALLHGTGHNRWYDKTMQFIVFENGKAGFLGEVSPAAPQQSNAALVTSNASPMVSVCLSLSLHAALHV